MNISVFDSVTVSEVFTSTVSNRRYWVGGTASWDGTAGTKWAETSGGTGGASVPTLSDDVFLDANSGASTITVITTNPTCRNFDCTGFTGTLAGSIQFNCYGNVTLGSGMTVTMTSGLDLRGNGWSKTFTSNGVYMSGPVWLNQTSPGGISSWTFVNFLSTATLSNFAGSLDISGNITVASFGTFGTDTRTINMGSGLWTITAGGTSAEFRLTSVTGLTWNKQTANIKFTSTTGTTTFVGGGKSFNQVWLDRGTNSSNVLFSIGGTFTELKDTGTVAHSLRFYSNTTWTFDDFTVAGSAGKLVKIDIVGTNPHTLVNTGNGITPYFSSNYLDVQHSNATGYPWYAGLNSVDNQSVAVAGSGWIFNTAPFSVSESISVVENIQIEIPKLNIAVADTISISDNISISIPKLFISVNESVSLTENIQLGVSDITRLVFDAVSVSENISLFIPSLKISTFDAVSISENILLKIQTLFISVSESIATSEFLNISEITGISIIESISTTDNIQIKIAYLLLSSIETITISEVSAVSVPYIPIVIFDIISLSDASHFSAIDKYGYDVEEYRPMGSIVFTRGYMEE